MANRTKKCTATERIAQILLFTIISKCLKYRELPRFNLIRCQKLFG